MRDCLAYAVQGVYSRTIDRPLRGPYRAHGLSIDREAMGAEGGRRGITRDRRGPVRGATGTVVLTFPDNPEKVHTYC
jgi:hypothetical protein